MQSHVGAAREALPSVVVPGPRLASATIFLCDSELLCSRFSQLYVVLVTNDS